MNREIVVGFGYAEAARDGVVVYSESNYAQENPNAINFPTAQSIEDMAAKDPEHVWRIRFYAAFAGETYQRNKNGEWVLIESNEGFA